MGGDETIDLWPIRIEGWDYWPRSSAREWVVSLRVVARVRSYWFFWAWQ
jgi:hypothetical protein